MTRQTKVGKLTWKHTCNSRGSQEEGVAAGSWQLAAGSERSLTQALVIDHITCENTLFICPTALFFRAVFRYHNHGGAATVAPPGINLNNPAAELSSVFTPLQMAARPVNHAAPSLMSRRKGVIGREWEVKNKVQESSTSSETPVTFKSDHFQSQHLVLRVEAFIGTWSDYLTPPEGSAWAAKCPFAAGRE